MVVRRDLVVSRWLTSQRGWCWGTVEHRWGKQACAGLERTLATERNCEDWYNRWQPAAGGFEQSKECAVPVWKLLSIPSSMGSMAETEGWLWMCFHFWKTEMLHATWTQIQSLSLRSCEEEAAVGRNDNLNAPWRPLPQTSSHYISFGVSALLITLNRKMLSVIFHPKSV